MNAINAPFQYKFDQDASTNEKQQILEAFTPSLASLY